MPKFQFTAKNSTGYETTGFVEAQKYNQAYAELKSRGLTILKIEEFEMPQFRFTAIKGNGKEVSGTVEADNEAEATERLEAQGLIVMTIRDAQAGVNEIESIKGSVTGGGAFVFDGKSVESIVEPPPQPVDVEPFHWFKFLVMDTSGGVSKGKCQAKNKEQARITLEGQARITLEEQGMKILELDQILTIKDCIIVGSLFSAVLAFLFFGITHWIGDEEQDLTVSYQPSTTQDERRPTKRKKYVNPALSNAPDLVYELVRLRDEIINARNRGVSKWNGKREFDRTLHETGRMVFDSEWFRFTKKAHADRKKLIIEIEALEYDFLLGIPASSLFSLQLADSMEESEKQLRIFDEYMLLSKKKMADRGIHVDYVPAAH